MFQRILVSLDGSSRALQVLSVAAHLARSVGGSVIVLRVVNPALEVQDGLDFSSPLPLAQTIVEGDLAEAERYVAEMTMSPDLRNVTTETVVLSGPVAPTILSVASSYHADLIVIGGHRATGRPHWPGGCVVERVARHTSIPVLILQEGGLPLTDAHRNAVTARRILVPLDGSALAEAALAPVASLRDTLAAPCSHCPPDEVKKDACTLEAAQHYLSTVITSHALGPQTTCSIAVDADVASALTATAGQGKQAKENDGETRCTPLRSRNESGVECNG